MAEPFIEEKTRKIALLIDGDNAQPSLIEQMLAEAGKYGSSPSAASTATGPRST